MRQLTVDGSTTTEPIRPVNLRFCVDPETLDSTVSLGFLQGVYTADTLTDTVLREYLNGKAQEPEGTVTLDTLDALGRTALVMDMKDASAISRMESLFVSYHKLLHRHGLHWVLEKNQKIAVYNVLSAVKPGVLHNRLGSDLDFANCDCHKGL